MSKLLSKIHPLNILFTLTSLTVVAVSIERFSPSAKIFLQPYNFFRLHEILQMTTLILLTVVIPFLTVWIVTNKFSNLHSKFGIIIMTIFIIGIYFYATGNGVHETASFYLNTYCTMKHLVGIRCNSLFFNDYYTGNIMYFAGAFLMNLVLIVLENKYLNSTFHKKDRILLIVNSLVYSLAIIAYAAFDVVLVGLGFSVIMTIFVSYYFLLNRKRMWQIPVTTSMLIAYGIGTVISILIRLR